MNVLALKGEPNCGKTETLNLVYHLLLLNGYKQVSGHFRVLGNPIIRDFIDVLVQGDKKIGIVTQGDYVVGENKIAAHLKYLADAGCTIIICACTSGNPKGQLQVEVYPSHTFIEKAKASFDYLERIENNAVAQKIYTAV